MPKAWTLLIIDDCAADRKIYRRYLLKDPHQSYQILEADSAKDGLNLCQERHCDAILLDFCLPDMSGLKFLDELRQHQFETRVPVIMLTGHSDEAVAVEAMKQGAHDYLVKQHLKADVLQLAVRNAIEKSCLEAQLNKTQERQRLIATTALRIRQSLNLEEILKTTVAEVQQLLKCDRVVVYQFVSAQGNKMFAKSVESFRSVPDNIIQDTCSWQKVGKDYHWECTRSISKICEAGLSNCCLNLLEQLTPSNLVVPITLINSGESTSEPWGLLIGHHCSGKRQWQPDELEILNELSVQLALAIQQAELLAQTQTALEKEKQLNALKSQIITTVSHEYRTPLTSILAAASTLKQNCSRLDESKQHKILKIIEEKARHMARLVDDLLAVNQFELSKTKFKPLPLDLIQFFSDLVEEQQEIASDRHELIFQIAGNTKGFWGDRGLLRQIFVNLMSNAIKYSPDGGNVEVHLIGEDSQVIFHVQDEGIGIPIEDQVNLFQSFSRGSNVDTISGTGLGLAIAKACVELHGGNITLESQVGRGTKVTISLPKRDIQERNDSN